MLCEQQQQQQQQKKMLALLSLVDFFLIFQSNEHMAVTISTGVFVAMPINIHQRAGQLQNPHLLCCGN